jgi:hypothetical protein
MSIFPDWIGPVGTGGGTVITHVTVVGGEILIDFAEEDLVIELDDDALEITIEDEPLTMEL